MDNGRYPINDDEKPLGTNGRVNLVNIYNNTNILLTIFIILDFYM